MLNDLAWVLQSRGDLAGAEPIVREALTLNDKLANAWDTLGVILMRRGAHAEAEEALRKSLALFAENPVVQLHLAQLAEKRGEAGKAADLADELLARPTGLDIEDQEELRRISRRKK